MHPTNEKLTLLRSSMKERGVDAYIIPASDPNLGEYIPEHWRIIPWLTGFTGSAATIVVTDSFAGLWTDSRYFVQAEKQLTGSGFVLMKYIPAENKDFIEWLAGNLAHGKKIGLDGRIFSIGRLRKLQKSIDENVIKIDTDCDLISDLWNDRPLPAGAPAFDHSVLFCGKERSVKINEVRSEMERQGIDYHLLTAADDIMWLLNIRGSDVKYSPLLLSFAIVGKDQILLFAEENKIPFKIAWHCFAAL
jgi:Xaa-Pro aminopeptidase